MRSLHPSLVCLRRFSCLVTVLAGFAATAWGQDLKLLARDPAGHGLLCQCGPKTILMVSGTPEQMGTAHGTLLHDGVQKLTNRVLYAVGAMNTFQTGTWFLDHMAEIQRRTLPHIPARFLAECDALSAAAGMSPRDGRYANLFPEQFHCSGVGLRGKATVGGKVLHARVLDYMRDIGLQSNACVMVFMPEGRNAWMSLSYSGFIGTVTAMNEKGLAIGEMGGRGQGDWDGTPMTYLLRDIMERAATVDEALDIFRKTPRTCEYYYVVTDKSGAMRGLCCTAKEMTVLEPGQQNPMLPHVPEDTILMSAGERAVVLSQRVQEHYGKIDVPQLIEILKRPVAMQSNLHDAIFAPETLEMWFADAGKNTPACDEPYAPRGFPTVAPLLPIDIEPLSGHAGAQRTPARELPGFRAARFARRLSRLRDVPDDGRGAAASAAWRRRCPAAASGHFSAITKATSQWLGCSLHDLIQPSFSFLVGVALPFSHRQPRARGQSALPHDGPCLLARACSWCCWASSSAAPASRKPTSRSKTRSPRSASATDSCSCSAFVPCAISGSRSGVILVGYWAAFALYPLPGPDFDYANVGVSAGWLSAHGLTGFAAHWNKNSNLAWAFDTWFLNLFPARNARSSCNGGGYATLSFIPTLGTMILGLLAGDVLRSERTRLGQSQAGSRSPACSAWRSAGCSAGSGICPVVKRIWTPSWVLFSGGWCFLAARGVLRHDRHLAAARLGISAHCHRHELHHRLLHERDHPALHRRCRDLPLRPRFPANLCRAPHAVPALQTFGDRRQRAGGAVAHPLLDVSPQVVHPHLNAYTCCTEESIIPTLCVLRVLCGYS